MTPQNETDLSDCVRGATGPIQIRGGGTRGMVSEGVVLDTTALSGITLYEPGALTMVAQSGTPVAEIEAALAKEKQRLAFEPMDHRALLGTNGEPTIGGIIAGNISGPRRIQVGAARDFALGVRFVDGTGQIIKNGGRVMKNVTGYDLVKLMCGSWGTLGVLSEVSLKVLPVPETELTLVVHGLAPIEAVAAMSAALGSPFDVTGVSHDPQQQHTLVRLEGFGDSVAYRGQCLTKTLGSFGEVSQLEAADSVAAWDAVRNVTRFAGTQGDVWRVSVKPSDGPRVLAAASAESALMDWGGGLVWVRMPQGADLRARLRGIPGHATLVRGDASTRSRLGVFAPEPQAIASLTAGLRARFDPRGILNPGLMSATEQA